MTSRWWVAVAVACLFPLVSDASEKRPGEERFSEASLTGTTWVLLRTEAGDIELSLDLRHAPVTSANFLRYVEGGHYANGLFHRTVRADNQPDNKIKIGVIQAGPGPIRSSASPTSPRSSSNAPA